MTEFPPRPKDIPPSMGIDPVTITVTDTLPVTVAGSANRGVTWTLNKRDNVWEPGPLVTYSGVQLTLDTGPAGAATAVGDQWAPWSASVQFPTPGAHWVSAAGTTTGGELVSSARVPVKVADVLWHTVGYPGPPPSWQAAFDPVEWSPSARWAPVLAASCAEVNGELQLVAIGTGAGQLWHTTFNGTWAPDGGAVETWEQNNPWPFIAVGCGGTGGELQVAAVDSTSGQLWHTIREADGSWQPFFGLIEANEGNDPGRFFAVSAAGVGPDCHVVGLAVNPEGTAQHMWHTIRYSAAGSTPAHWQGAFDEVPWPAGAGQLTTVSCATVAGQLHLIALDGNGLLWHNAYTAGAAQPWSPDAGPAGVQVPGGGALSAAGCAGVGADLHVAGVSEQLWHTIRHADGTWEEFTAIGAQQPGPWTGVSCAGVGADLHVAAVMYQPEYQ